MDQFPEIWYPHEKALDNDYFREMDYYAVKNLHLPIELMMENAGLQLARLATRICRGKGVVTIGCGNGNNGGGGLVAARRLAAWGFQVHLDLPQDINKTIPRQQLQRAMSFGCLLTSQDKPNLWIDAYYGFSQRLPLDVKTTASIAQANKSKSHRLSLDMPSGFVGQASSSSFQADSVLTLAASKKHLYDLPVATELFVADLGLPLRLYEEFKAFKAPFEKSQIFKIRRD